jgi:hypothetical protein
MSLFAIEGTLTALGQCEFDNLIVVYAYIEITKATGERVLVEKVAVCSDVSARLRLGQEGEFFIDRIRQVAPAVRCQLWGLKSDGVTTLDSKDLRRRISAALLVQGILMLPLFGAGLLMIIPALIRLMASGPAERRKLFYGAESPSPNKQAHRVAHI